MFTTLNARQAKFVADYLKTGNATQSAIKAGYSKKSAGVRGHELLQNVEIIQKLNDAYNKNTSKAVMTGVQAMELLTRIASGEEKETVVISTPQGAYTTEKEANLQTRISALKELIRRQPTETDALRYQQIKKIEKQNRILDEQIKKDSEGDVSNGITLMLNGAPQEDKESESTKNEDNNNVGN